MSNFEKILAVYSGIYEKKRLFSTPVYQAKLVLCANEIIFLENDNKIEQFSRAECLKHKILWRISAAEIESVVLFKLGTDAMIVHVCDIEQREYKCTIYQPDYQNIGNYLDTMGLKWKTDGFKRGKDTFNSVPKQYQEPPKEKERRDKGEIIRLKGLERKKIIVYEDHVLLTFSGGDSKILISDITKVDFRVCSKSQIGYIRLRYPGSDARKKPENDDNSILWDNDELNESAQDLKNVIEQRLLKKAPKSSPVCDASFSVADEIIKLKSLLDEGVITQEEFDKQKSKLFK